jgi:hypothetical protein
MKNCPHHTLCSSNEKASYRNLVRVIEEIMERRREEMREERARFHIWSRDDWPRDWMASELRDTVYSSYLALCNGKLKRPPPLHTVMEIADYSECNLEERNRLLVAARYAPIPPFLSGDALKIGGDMVATQDRVVVWGIL